MTGAENQVILSVWWLLNLGLLMSKDGHVVHRLHERLAESTGVEKPDPTGYMRPFERWFDGNFAPIGHRIANKSDSPIVSSLSFLLTIGVAVLATAFVVYVGTAGALTGAAFVSYQTFGSTFDPAPMFRLIVAAGVGLSFAVMFHAEERAKELANQ